jgi:propionyl-CoA carboxylase alpha chain
VITTLLIANRGEIARRIAATAAAMGITTVAAYAEGDAGAPFVSEADRAVALPGRTSAETYLNIDALLRAAAATGADAVHPGYGFLAERAAFARAVTGAGLTWVGPPADVIELMGDKLAAKAAMAAIGVPVLPSWEVTGSRLPDLADLPLPMLVKAAAGGGGKGMRVVSAVGELPGAVAAASREAGAAFGDPTVFLEPYVTGARHVEIQILADDHGGAVHCFERECSIQRRHQKIIEECPSPAVDAGLRDRMCAVALATAKAVGYRGAGTVEFVLEPSGNFWFLEVNTRLQVEHPVTEAVTGLDLVREQLLVAQGLPLSVAQADLAITGHAIEARLCAEDPAAGFLPTTGALLEWRPATDPPSRWDSGVEEGSLVGVEFDPMLAKIIAHAPTRTEAALRLALALERSRIRGIVTNRDFLVATLRHPDFLAGNTTTAFIELAGVPVARRLAGGELHIAAVAAALTAQADARAATPVLRTLPSGWRNTVMPPEKAVYRHGTGALEVSYRRQRDGRFAVAVTDLAAAAESGGHGWPASGESAGGDMAGDGSAGRDTAGREPAGGETAGGGLADGDGAWGGAADGDAAGGEAVRMTVAAHQAGGGWIGLEEGGLRHRLHVFRHGRRVWVQGPVGDVALAEVPRFPEAEPELVAGGLVAPMPGTVLAVHVKPGDTVTAGQLVMVVEAMKMEHRITAPQAGRVAEVRAYRGDQVSGGDLLAVIDEAT